MISKLYLVGLLLIPIVARSAPQGQQGEKVAICEIGTDIAYHIYRYPNTFNKGYVLANDQLPRFEGLVQFRDPQERNVLTAIKVATLGEMMGAMVESSITIFPTLGAQGVHSSKPANFVYEQIMKPNDHVIGIVLHQVNCKLTKQS